MVTVVSAEPLALRLVKRKTVESNFISTCSRAAVLRTASRTEAYWRVVVMPVVSNEVPVAESRRVTRSCLSFSVRSMASASRGVSPWKSKTVGPETSVVKEEHAPRAAQRRMAGRRARTGEVSTRRARPL